MPWLFQFTFKKIHKDLSMGKNLTTPSASLPSLKKGGEAHDAGWLIPFLLQQLSHRTKTSSVLDRYTVQFQRCQMSCCRVALVRGKSILWIAVMQLQHGRVACGFGQDGGRGNGRDAGIPLHDGPAGPAG